MGSICSATKTVRSITTSSSKVQVTVNAETKESVTLPTPPKTYSELLRVIGGIYKVPEHFLVLKSVRNGQETSLCDEASYAILLSSATSIDITAFFPRREALLGHRSSNQEPTRPAYSPGNTSGWGILKPVPIDVVVEQHLSKDSFESSGVAFSAKMEKEPKTATCANGFVKVLDTATEDCFKYFGETVEETSRVVVLPSGNILITGGLTHPVQALKIETGVGTSRQISPLKQGRYSHAVVHHLGCSWVIGGLSQNGLLASCERLVGEQWMSVAPMQVPRSNHSVSCTEESIYVYGGTAEVSIERYITDSWTRLKPILPKPIALAGVSPHDDQTVLITGGLADTDLSVSFFLSLESGAIQSSSALPKPDHFACVAVRHKEKTYLLGAGDAFVYVDGTWKCVN